MGMDSHLGRRIADKFEIESCLGAGAMGVVYRAKQTSLDKWVCVKIMRDEAAADPIFAARFHREAQIASRIDHPCSLRIIDFGVEPDGLRYIVMEHIDGRDLAALLAEELFSEERIVDILSQTLAALAVAHEHGIVHRDLKPENLMVARGEREDGSIGDVVKLCDYGIAQVTAASAKLTTAGVLVGTPEYMSPEQARGEPLDGRSDLYAVGVVLYQMLTGRLPFEGATPLDVALMQIKYPVLSPSELAPNITPALEEVCLRALEKDRTARFQTAREMRTALRSAIDAVPLVERTNSLPTLTAAAPSPPERSRWMPFVVAVAVIGAAGATSVRSPGMLDRLGTPTAPAPSVLAATPPPAVVSDPPSDAVVPPPVEKISPRAPEPAPAPAYNLSSAHVEIRVPASTSGATTLAIQRAINACYRDALPRLRGVTAGTGVLHVETNDAGLVVRARLDGSFERELGPCMTRAPLGARVASGSARADVPIVYRPR